MYEPQAFQGNSDPSWPWARHDAGLRETAVDKSRYPGLPFTTWVEITLSSIS